MYCGAALPEGQAVAVEERSLPTDLDQLVRQAMTLGTTHRLESALRSHQPDLESNDATKHDEEAISEPEKTRTERLIEMQRACAEAVSADAAQDEETLFAAVAKLREELQLLGPLSQPSPDGAVAVDAGPVILLPKVRRPYALVMEGPGNIELHESIARALDIDGVTARMLALARQPRVVLRGEDRKRLEDMACGVREHLSLSATVIDADTLRSMGPASLLIGFGDGPTTHPIADWSVDFKVDGLTGEAMVEPPALIVPGEIVISQYREARQGGRLKHLREGRKQASSEKRLAIVDVHIPNKIVRILEQYTNLSDAPGSTDSFRQSLKSLLQNWSEQGILTLESRTCTASVDGGVSGGAEAAALRDTGWASWEEHSRSARALFMGE